jgi:hypothetical protein
MITNDHGAHRANGLVALCHRGVCNKLSFLLMKNLRRHVLEKK